MENLREGEKKYSIAIIIRNVLLYMAVMELISQIFSPTNGVGVAGALVVGGFLITITLIITFFKRKRYINPVKNYLKTLMLITIINIIPVVFAHIYVLVALMNR